MGLEGGVKFDDVGLLLKEMSFIVDGVLRTQIVGGAFGIFTVVVIAVDGNLHLFLG